MPCRDDWNDHRTVEETRHGMTMSHFEAAMCGILSAVEQYGNDTTLEGRVKMLFNQVDWKEAGVKRKTVENWWVKHKEEDAARRAREAAEKHKNELKASALSKLTIEERAALGVK
jgi:hypothetical protein